MPLAQLGSGPAGGEGKPGRAIMLDRLIAYIRDRERLVCHLRGNCRLVADKRLAIRRVGPGLPTETARSSPVVAG
jgi:hypothetical protein